MSPSKMIFVPIMGNAINLSNAIVESNRKRVPEISAEESIFSYRMNIMLYLFKELAIIQRAKASAVILNNLSSVLKIYLIPVFGILCITQMSLTNNPAGQIVPYKMSKKFLEIKQILFAVEMQKSPVSVNLSPLPTICL